MNSSGYWLKQTGKLSALMLLLGVSACATNGQGINPCTEFNPIYISARDILTDDSVRQILSFNERWAALCD